MVEPSSEVDVEMAKELISGINTGLAWCEEWMAHGRPGGPWRTVNHGPLEHRARQQALRDEWHRGFDIGLTLRLPSCPGCGKRLSVVNREHFGLNPKKLDECLGPNIEVMCRK